MALSNIFTSNVSEQVISRIEQLTAATTPNWGKMNVAQMLAHCNVTYELVYENKHKAPGFIMKLMLKYMVKKHVTNEIPYKSNLRTAPYFIVVNEKEFETEKTRLIDHIRKTQELGEKHFDGLESLSFGKLTTTEWNNMFYKHLDHHLKQFGV